MKRYAEYPPFSLGDELELDIESSMNVGVIVEDPDLPGHVPVGLRALVQVRWSKTDEDVYGFNLGDAET
ncbi:MAG TPA: hypothetical protein PLV86_08900 [Candidatus Fermentibacter daniensis]|jgi:hypothetical protein|nr:hypothetical protein [Candidatus Fermentibacter daniensis]HOG55484.1 hypothetical protein [Candidatus Fermentibacter daniensis]HQM41857.1 hypothetical protein [Candidatus Fermentibacter daniensis]